MAETTGKQTLTSELASARGRMTGYAAAIRRDLDVGARLKISVTRNSPAWYAGAAVLGLLLSKIPPMHRKVVVGTPAFFPSQTRKAGKLAMLLGVLKFAADFAKPALLFWSKRRFLSGRPSPQAPRDER